MKVAIDLTDIFSAFGAEILSEAKGISQYFDRDAHPEVARIGMDMMTEVLANPGALEKGLVRLEEARKRIYGK